METEKNETGESADLARQPPIARKKKDGRNADVPGVCVRGAYANYTFR